MSKLLDYDDYIDKRVYIRHTSKAAYIRKSLIGKCGLAVRTSGNLIGVLIDEERNPVSAYRLFWFRRSELKIIENESEDMNMTGFKNVAVVNLLEDCNKKDYGVALYDAEMNLITRGDQMVVVDVRGKGSNVLGTIKEITTIEEYGKAVHAQVVGVVNTDGYTARINEENRLKEIAKKKTAIEKELEAEINKRKSVEYYEEMASRYSDNPKLAKLVAELKGLGV